MKRGSFITLFVSMHVLFLFLHIHKHIRYVQHSYTKQRLDRQAEQLEKQNAHLMQQLYALQNRTDIQHFAHAELNMRPIALNQIETFEDAAC